MNLQCDVQRTEEHLRLKAAPNAAKATGNKMGRAWLPTARELRNDTKDTDSFQFVQLKQCRHHIIQWTASTKLCTSSQQCIYILLKHRKESKTHAGKHTAQPSSVSQEPELEPVQLLGLQDATFSFFGTHGIHTVQLQQYTCTHDAHNWILGFTLLTLLGYTPTPILPGTEGKTCHAASPHDPQSWEQPPHACPHGISCSLHLRPSPP